MIAFTSSDPVLEEGFAWAKQRALLYAHHGEDPVGLWYEAALPGRDAFCIRDAAHQRAGAALLGLKDHTFNMFRRFAASISNARDDCMYWEIDKSGGPAPVDYTSDTDFWYNLPANFDLLQACWQEFLWTGDARYLTDEVFLRFYERSCTGFVTRWDRDGDGLPDHRPSDGRRGLASYHEQGRSPHTAGDMLAAMVAGYAAYANILRTRGDVQHAHSYEQKADELRARYQTQWYDEKKGRFYGAMRGPGKFAKHYAEIGHFFPVYMGLLDASPLLPAALNEILAHGPQNVEEKTYFPAFCIGRGREAEGFTQLRELCAPDLKRRDYPEVSFAVVSSLVSQVLGITVPEPNTLQTCAYLAQGEWAQGTDMPVFGGSITVRQEGTSLTQLAAQTETPLLWRACFPCDVPQLFVDGQSLPAQHSSDAAGRPISFVDVEVSNAAREIAVHPR